MFSLTRRHVFQHACRQPSAAERLCGPARSPSICSKLQHRHGTVRGWHRLAAVVVAAENTSGRGQVGPVVPAEDYAPEEERVEGRQRQESTGEASTSSIELEFPLGAEDTEEQKRLRHKTKILLEILTAGESVENKIAEHADEIDQLMLDILDKRTQASVRLKEDRMATAGLQLMRRRLVAEMDKKQASPSQLLLNELLDLLAPVPGIHMEEQLQEAEVWLTEAFTPPQREQVDIFATAARLARGEEVAPPGEDIEGYVPQQQFISETETLLSHAKEAQLDLQRLIERGDLGQREASLRHAMNIRQDAIDQVTTILTMARSIYV